MKITIEFSADTPEAAREVLNKVRRIITYDLAGDWRTPVTMKANLEAGGRSVFARIKTEAKLWP